MILKMSKLKLAAKRHAIFNRSRLGSGDTPHQQRHIFRFLSFLLEIKSYLQVVESVWARPNTKAHVEQGCQCK